MLKDPPERPAFVLAWIGLVIASIAAVQGWLAPGPAEAVSRPSEEPESREATEVAPTEVLYRNPAAWRLPPVLNAAPAHSQDRAAPDGELLEQREGEPELLPVESAAAVPVAKSGGTSASRPSMQVRDDPARGALAGTVLFAYSSGGGHDPRTAEEDEELVLELQSEGRRRYLLRLSMWLRYLETHPEEFAELLEVLPPAAAQRLRRAAAEGGGRSDGSSKGPGVPQLRNALKQFASSVARRGWEPRLDVALKVELDSAQVQRLLRRLDKLALRDAAQS